MPTLTRELVHRYVESAQPFADSETERLAIRFAARINLHSETAEVVVIPSMGRITRGVDQEWLLDVLTKRVPGRRRQKEAKAAKEVLSWKQLIVREIHTALCTRSNRYRKQADALKHNANLLIASIAGYIARYYRRGCGNRGSTRRSFAAHRVRDGYRGFLREVSRLVGFESFG